MSKTLKDDKYKRPAIRQHREVLHDGAFSPVVVKNKKKETPKKLTKKQLMDELNEGYRYGEEE